MARRIASNRWAIGGIVAAILILLGSAVLAIETRNAPESTPYVVPDAAFPKAPSFTVPNDARVLFLGDSLTDGTATTDKATLGYAPRLAKLEGWSDYRVDGIGLSGFLSPGISEDAHRNYRDRLQQMYFTKSYAPNTIIFQAGANDQAYPADAVQAKVIETVNVARKYFPDAEMILLGPVTSSPDLTAVNDAYARGAYESGIPYIDAKRKPIIPSSERERLISADGWHPNDAGHQVIAEALVLRIGEYKNRQ